MEQNNVVLIVNRQPFPLEMPREEGSKVWLDPLMMAIAMRNVSLLDINAFQSKRIDFYLQEINHIISFVVNIDDLGWAEGLFTTRGQPVGLEPIHDPKIGYGIQLVLVALPSFRVAAQRFIGLGHQFSRELYRITHGQSQQAPMSEAEFKRRSEEVVSRFRSPEALAQVAGAGYSTESKGEKP